MKQEQTTRRIAIVGAGQAALCLAVSLQRTAGYEVTFVTDRSAEEVRRGPILASQVLFGPALDGEAAAGVETWVDEAPDIRDLVLTLGTAQGEAEAPTMRAPLEFAARSVDLRLKTSTWLEQLEELGATVLTQRTEAADLEKLAAGHDLVVVASGKGALGEAFERDEGRTRGEDAPGRELAVALVRPAGRDVVGDLTVQMRREVGELFRYPMLTDHGVGEVVMIEGIVTPGSDKGDDDGGGDGIDGSAQGAADGSQGAGLGAALRRLREAGGATAEQVLAVAAEYFPEQAGALAGATALDDGAVTLGRVRARVNKPVGTLPSGATVLGLGTAVVTTEPLFSAPSNNAALAADYYRTAIVRRGDAPFDDEWKRRTFESFWRGWAKWTVQWVGGLLDGLTDTQQALIRAAVDLPGVAGAIAEMVEDPRTAHQWWYNADEARVLVEQARADQRAGIDARDLRAAFGRYATGVTIVTTRNAEGVDIGVTANSFTSVSIDPPLVLWCPQLTSTSLPAFEESDHFCINVLTAAQLPVSRQMSVSGSTEKFKGVDVERGRGGVPVITGSAATFQCRVVARYDAGDHRIHVGEVEEYSWNEEPPLGFLGGRYTGV